MGKYIKDHPGEEKAILFQHHAGKDITNEFDEIGVTPTMVENLLEGSEPGVMLKGPVSDLPNQAPPPSSLAPVSSAAPSTSPSVPAAAFKPMVASSSMSPASTHGFKGELSWEEI